MMAVHITRVERIEKTHETVRHGECAQSPPGADVRHDDTGVVPALPWLPGPIRFTVVGKPNHGPLGVSIPVREGV